MVNPYHSLYLHVPFCQNICDYCNLYSVVNNENSTRTSYLELINAQLKDSSGSLVDLQSIFVGGGTPSQLTMTEMKYFLKAVNENITLKSDYEFSVECNPSSITEDKLKLLLDSGVNRLSFGAQSTTRKTRGLLGRRTSKSQLDQALDSALKVGFTNINIDLIYAVPGQELEDWEYDLKTALDYDLPHYSAYSLILEEDTVLAEKFSSVDDELAVDMYDMTAEMLSTKDLSRYEISNYSKLGKHCKHNYDIWKGKSYLGIGPAATSYDGQKRWSQIRDLEKWIDGHKPEVDEIPARDRAGEVISFGFRTVGGWQKTELENICGVNTLIEFSNIFADLINSELIYEVNNSLKPTEQGLLFADSVAEAFIFI
ncbi:MAG: radical SAM family heme chaperone HemW [Lentisphaeraceae bacterium]|nr:radical SAM family heme chaperone HemW [Lentisphaeraceae bacterium]